jgi:hypothetical protein
MGNPDEIVLVPNRPTDAGRALGRELARLADHAEAESLTRFPNSGARCRTCAFRLGTVPNGCELTLMDALKAVIEQFPFMCHETIAQGAKIHCVGNGASLCAGWATMISAPLPDGLRNVVAPWEYSK